MTESVLLVSSHNTEKSTRPSVLNISERFLHSICVLVNVSLNSEFDD